MIDLTVRDRIATLSLARGSARNAIPVAGWAALAARVREVADSGARAVILRSGDAGVFSAGADISEFDVMRTDASARADFLDRMRDAIDGLHALPMPVIAAVDGGCFGAAVALAMAADIVVAGDSARFATTPAKLGLSYPAEDVARLIDRVGRGGAMRMLATGDAINADAALATGLADVRAPDAGAAASEMAARIAGNAPGAVASLKRIVRNLADPAHRTAFLDQFESDEFAEGLAAFAERRPARFP